MIINNYLIRNYIVEDDQQRFISETGEESHYWFTLSSFADLSIQHGLDKVLHEVLQLRMSKLEKLNG
jgi:hypothetical protein